MNLAKLASLLLCLAVLLSACSSQSTVLTVAGEDICYDMYRYFYLNYKAESDSYTEEELHTKTLDAIKSDTSLTLLADKYEVELTKEDKESCKQYLDSVIKDYGSKDAYKSSLEKNYLTEELFKHFYMQQLLEARLRDYMGAEQNGIIKSDDATFEKDLEKNFMAARQILLRNDELDDPEKNRALAQDILERALNGEDFSALAEQYSEDSSADVNYTYHFTKGQMLLAFEEAVLDTNAGEICSYVAESEVGFHIIMRLPLDPDFVDANYEELRDAYKARCFNEIREGLITSSDIEYSDNFEELTFE